MFFLFKCFLFSCQHWNIEEVAPKLPSSGNWVFFVCVCILYLCFWIVSFCVCMFLSIMSTEWRDQKFHPRPIPRIFLRPNISETNTETFFKTKYFWDRYRNFFETKYFQDRYRDFFLDQIFWDRHWVFFKYDFKFRIWLRIFTHMDISNL